MTRHVPIAVLKDKVSEVIASVEAGEEVIITRHGKEAARIVPIESTDERRRRAREALARMAEQRERMRAEGKTATIDEIIAWKNEGRP